MSVLVRQASETGVSRVGSTDMMPQIALIDPALGRTGAHNRSFALLLARQGAGKGEIGVWCNEMISHDLCGEMVAQGVTVKPLFDVDFYRILQKHGGGVADHWDWIYHLSQQYLQAFEQVLEQWPQGLVEVIHHTLSWEHASALALALELGGSRMNRLRHLVFLMFSPGVDAAGDTYDAIKALNYRLAFRWLTQFGSVSLYAGCSEYASAYERLLGLSDALSIHPCFLGDWGSRPLRQPRPGAPTLLLYAGEIKKEKGFLQLPKLLESLLQTASAETRLIIQFVAVRNDSARKVQVRLDQLAKDDPRVEIHHGFWSDETLQETLATVDVLYLNYDASAYCHSTSGLLWLAAWYGISVVVPDNTWLRREAGRLGVRVVAGDGTSVNRASPADPAAFDAGYFAALFTPFWSWLSTAGDEIVAACGKRDQFDGADIVIFWKQNDTGLYGRRSDMIVRYLASRPDVRKVMVVDAPIGDANLEKLAEPTATPTQHQRVHTGIQQKLLGAWDTAKVSYHVYVCPLKQYRFRDDGTSRPQFIEGYLDYLGAAFSTTGIDPSSALLWFYPTNFNASAIIDRFKPARVIVDVEDDQRSWPGVAEETRRRLTGNYKELLIKADSAMTNCQPLRHAMQSFFPDIRLVPNGCDVDPPRVIPKGDPVFNQFIRFPGKTIGFVGNLESKIDVALLQKVADRFPGCQVVLLGSTHANPDAFALSRNPNVCMPGVVPYDELDAWMGKFDVGLVPHLRTELTQAMNPQKIYAYLASNVPVVSTDVPNIPRDTDLVRVAAAHDQFLDAVADVLEVGRPSSRSFHTYVEANSWAARLTPFVDELNLAGR